MANQVEVTDLSLKAASGLSTSDQVITFPQSGDATRTPLIEAVNAANNANGCICIKEASLAIATADVLQLNTTPLTIVAATGVGTAIEVISSAMSIDFNSVAYATNTDLDLIVDTAVDGKMTTDISQSGSLITNMEDAGGSGGSVYVENKSLLVKVRAGDPTAGDSDIKVFVTYRIITL